MKPKHKIIYVEWVDSFGGEGHWHAFNPECLDEEFMCYTAGYLIAESDDYVVVTSNISPESSKHATIETIFGEIIIPKVAIKKMKQLRG